MNVSRYFVLLGTLYLIAGIAIGMYMGASGDHALIPSHAHLNLLGFVLAMLFALTYKVFQAMDRTMMANAHFVLHALGATGVNVMVFLLFSGRIDESAMVPMAPASEGLVMLGVIVFFINALRNAR